MLFDKELQSAIHNTIVFVVEQCARCGKSVYAAEKSVFDDRVYHNLCLIARNKEEGGLTNKGGFWSSAAQGGTDKGFVTPPVQAPVVNAEQPRFCSGCGKQFPDSLARFW